MTFIILSPQKEGPKGQFAVKQICIVEDIAASHFGKDKDLGDCQFFFQVSLKRVVNDSMHVVVVSSEMC